MAEATTTEKFASLFMGNKNFYVKHQPPFTKDEDTGKVKGKWVGIAKDRATKEILSVTPEKYKEHLTGGDGLALEPLRENNKCFFAVIDIDVTDVNYTTLVQRLYKHGLKFAPFVSKSGGLHVYFFFQEEESGKDAMEAVTRVVEIFGLGRLYTSDKGKSKVEVFPKHATLKPDSQGSCVFLPYYNAANPKNCHNRMISSEGNLLGIEKAITAVQSLFTTVKEINRTLDALPYSDAPYCVQMLTLTGALGEGDGRNDFIFSAAVYLKKKQKENFFDELMAINNELAEPQEEKAVQDTYKSVCAKDFQYKCKSGPCAEYCDTKLCKKREYGVGRDKGNHFTGFACWGEISRVMAEEPYYIWKVQVDEGGEVKDLKLGGADDLMNQLVVARACITHLDRAPLPIKQQDWVINVNQALLGIKDRQIVIESATDTSDMGALKQYFTRFITHKQMNCHLPHLIQLNQVFFDEKDGNYYFTTGGFQEYLRVNKFVYGRINLREQLIRYGCSAATIKYTARGEERTLECWKKPKDEELSGMEVFYEDVLAIESDVVVNNPLNKEDEAAVTGGDGDEGTRF